MGPGHVREDAALERPRRPRRRFRRLRWLLGALAVVAVLYLTHPYTLPAAARFLDISEPPRPVDYIMVLGGDSSTRPFVAAALIKAGLAKKALVPTVKLSHDAADHLVPAEGELIRRVLVARGVPAADLVTLPDECNATIDEARAVAKFLDSRPEASLAVVTTTHHTRRSRWIFRRALGDRSSQVCFVAAPTEDYNETNWWRHEAGFKAYVNEYLKLAFYLWQYS